MTASSSSRFTQRILADHLPDPGQVEHSMNHGPHPAGCVDQVTHKFLSLGLELVAVVLQEKVGKRDQGAQRFLKIVRDDVHEFVELAISLRQRVVGVQALLHLFELAIDPAQLLVDLGQLERFAA